MVGAFAEQYLSSALTPECGVTFRWEFMATPSPAPPSRSMTAAARFTMVRARLVDGGKRVAGKIIAATSGGRRTVAGETSGAERWTRSVLDRIAMPGERATITAAPSRVSCAHPHLGHGPMSLGIAV